MDNFKDITYFVSKALFSILATIFFWWAVVLNIINATKDEPFTWWPVLACVGCVFMAFAFMILEYKREKMKREEFRKRINELCSMKKFTENKIVNK